MYGHTYIKFEILFLWTALTDRKWYWTRSGKANC